MTINSIERGVLADPKVRAALDENARAIGDAVQKARRMGLWIGMCAGMVVPSVLLLWFR